MVINHPVMLGVHIAAALLATALGAVQHLRSIFAQRATRPTARSG